VPTDAVRHDASNKNGESSKKSADKVDEQKAPSAVKAVEAGVNNIPEQGPML
jgi:hypothetical protein